MNRSLVYAYVEYCPGPFYGPTWWLYYAPIVDGLPDRKKSVWLKVSNRNLGHLMEALGLNIREDRHWWLCENREVSERFRAACPNGAFLWEEAGLFAVPEAGEVDIEGWRCLMHVREQQLMDWRNDTDRMTSESKVKAE